MKKRNLFITLGLVLGLGAGVFAGLNVKREVKEVRADSLDMYYVGQHTNVYMWKSTDDTVKNAAWPGESLAVEDGYLKSFTIDTTKGYDSVIFNGGDIDQTGTLSLPNVTKYYHKDGGAWLDESPIGVYLEGDFNSWSRDNNYKMSYDSTNNCAYLYNLSIEGTADKSVGMQATYYDGVNNTWYAATDHQEYGVKYADGSNVWLGGNNANIYFSASETINVDLKVEYGASSSSNKYCFANPCNITAKIGDTPLAMTSYLDSFDKFTANFTGVVAGSSISFTKTSDSSALSLVADSSAYNNLKDGKVQIGGNVTVEVYKTNEQFFIKGYSNFHDFATGFLDDTISGSTCSNPSATIKQDETSVWDWYKNWHHDFNYAEKTAFQAAVTKVGNNPSVFDGELEEAAARYSLLMKKYPSLTQFDDVELPFALRTTNVTNASNSETSPTGLIIIIISALSLIAVGGFIFAKTKER